MNYLLVTFRSNEQIVVTVHWPASSTPALHKLALDKISDALQHCLNVIGVNEVAES